MMCAGSRRGGNPAVISGFYHCAWCGKAFRLRRPERLIPSHISPAIKSMVKSAWKVRKSE